jgi:ferredoxin
VLQEGFDIQLLQSENNYIAQIGSEKALALYKKYQKLFGPAAKDDADKLLKKVKKQPIKFNLQKVKGNLQQEKINDGFWEDMGERCQSCGLCLFLCPTCSCYSVTDRDTPAGESRRSRQWDACYFRGFTRMAGGNDSVRNRAEMMNRKYQHKLAQQLDEFAMSGCVGCGRCTLACVGNVNWLDNIIKIERGS